MIKKLSTKRKDGDYALYRIIPELTKNTKRSFKNLSPVIAGFFILFVFKLNSIKFVAKYYYMKTNQIMIRELNGYELEQRTENSYFNANLLTKQYYEKTGIEKRVREFTDNKGTIEFIQALANELNTNSNNCSYLPEDLCITKKGAKGGTWMHPYLFLKYAMWLSPEFEVKVIKFVYDNLIEYRNQAGDYYKEMCDIINNRYLEFYDKKPDPLIFIKEANYLNQLVFGTNSGHRNEANEQQLELMNRLQKANIAMIKEGKGKQERYKILRDIAIYS